MLFSQLLFIKSPLPLEYLSLALLLALHALAQFYALYQKPINPSMDSSQNQKVSQYPHFIDSIQAHPL